MIESLGGNLGAYTAGDHEMIYDALDTWLGDSIELFLDNHELCSSIFLGRSIGFDGPRITLVSLDMEIPESAWDASITFRPIDLAPPTSARLLNTGGAPDEEEIETLIKSIDLLMRLVSDEDTEINRY